MMVSSERFRSNSSSTSMCVPSSRILDTLSRTSKKLSSGKSSCPSCIRRNSLISSIHVFICPASVEKLISSTRSLPNGDRQRSRRRVLISVKPIFCSKFLGYIIVLFSFCHLMERDMAGKSFMSTCPLLQSSGLQNYKMFL